MLGGGALEADQAGCGAFERAQTLRRVGAVRNRGQIWSRVMKTILASLTGLPGDHAALKTAAIVAKDHKAHVDALHVYMGLKAVESVMASYSSSSDQQLSAMSSELAREEGERRVRARAHFDEVCLRQDLPTVAAPKPGLHGPSAAFVDVDSLALAETARRARHYDLIVMAREHQLPPSRIPDVLMQSGRPLLIASANPRDNVGANIAIAWKPCAEAARAMSAAAPFLAKTSRVTLFVVPEAGARQADAIACAKPLQEALAWRGLQAHIVAPEPAHDAAQALREVIYAQEADLLVMGGYGHSRLREFVLGGMTHSLLKECDIPVLMAH
jgi:nucleotide-binding universal stress UspA family protein